MINNSVKWLSMALFNNKSLIAFFEPLIQMISKNFTVNRYRAKVMEIRQESKSVYTLRLQVSRFWKCFNAGQFIELIVEKNGTRYSRYFSISSPPELFKSHRVIELTIQKQSNGRITPWLFESTTVGQYLNISAAKGEFYIQNKTKAKLFIAAGTGITPFRSILAEFCSYVDVHLLYYARNSSHLCSHELAEINKLYKNIKVDFINSNDQGRFSLDHLQTYCPDYKKRESYICGPEEMIESIKQLLIENSVKEDCIKYEYFGVKPIKNLKIDTTGTVSFEHSSLKINSKKGSQKTLLQLAESKGLNPITGCRMGICHQCICQKRQGVVYNTLTQSFSDTGFEEVQLCVSVPVGNVSINL